MPCRCCNTSGSCVSSGDCAPGYNCCSGVCQNTASQITGPIINASTNPTVAECIPWGSAGDFRANICGLPSSSIAEVQWFVESGSVNAADVRWGARQGNIFQEGQFSTFGNGGLPHRFRIIDNRVEPNTAAGTIRLTVRAYDSLDVTVPPLADVTLTVNLCAKVPTPPPPTAVCCVGTTCHEGKTSAECSAMGGVWRSPITSCADNPCDPPSAVVAITVSNSNAFLDNQWDIYWNNAYVGRYSGNPQDNSSWNVTAFASNALRLVRVVCNGTDDLFAVGVAACGFSQNVSAGNDCPAPEERNFTVNCVLPMSLNAMAASSGPGTELKALLAKVGITSTPTCSCNQRAQEMDAKGVQWCRDNEELILSWLKEEADKRGLPFVTMAAKLLIRRAIRNAEKKANSQ